VEDVDIWKNKPVPPESAIELGTGYLAIRIQQKDPDGDYVVRAKVTDRRSGKTIKLEQQFSVVRE
jgi:hypothetical protein